MLRGTWILLLFLLAVLRLAAAQPWPRCDDSSGNYSAGSTYEANLLALADTLRGNASSSPSLFASGVIGAAPDTVYGLILCRGDVSFSDCFDCATFAGEDAGTACGRRIRDVSLCYNQCFVRLSDTDFLASTNNSGDVSLRSGTDIASDDVAGYDAAVTALLNATLEYAVDNSTRMFATGEWVGSDPGFSHIYSLAQCTPDLKPALCRSCLQDLLGQWWSEFRFRGKEDGGRITGPRCSLRSQLGEVPFYTGATMVQLPAKAAPAPGPTVIQSRPNCALAASPRTATVAPCSQFGVRVAQNHPWPGEDRMVRVGLPRHGDLICSAALGCVVSAVP